MLFDAKPEQILRAEFVLILAFAGALGPHAALGLEQGGPPASDSPLRRGVNVLGYDGIFKGETDAPFHMSDFRLIRDAGFDHVRVNFFGFHYLSRPDGGATALANLDRVIAAAATAGLSVVLDEHDNARCQSEPLWCKAALASFWRRIAARYAGREPKLVYDLLNEPGGAMSAAQWNDTLAAALHEIRAVDPARKVVVAALNDGAVSSVAGLELPRDDRSLIVSFHYYAPWDFAFQGAPWSSKWSRLHDIAWGSAAERAKLAEDFAFVDEWARAQARPVYLGEFGVYEKAPAASRALWTREVARSAEKFGWSWAYWQFDHDFALFDEATRRWNAPLLEALSR